MEVVNGFQCRNCTDVDYAKKHIDPAHPKDGPYGINAKDQPNQVRNEPAVKFGGALAGLNQTAAVNPATGAVNATGQPTTVLPNGAAQPTGSVLDLTA